MDLLTCADHNLEFPCKRCEQEQEAEYQKALAETKMGELEFKLLVHFGPFGNFILGVLDAHPSLGLEEPDQSIEAAGGLAEDMGIAFKDRSGFWHVQMKLVPTRGWTDYGYEYDFHFEEVEVCALGGEIPGER